MTRVLFRTSPIRRLLLLAGIAVAASVVTSGSRPGATAPPQPVLECRWADQPIRIDGKGSEASWKAAAVIDRFMVPGKDGRAAQTPMRARLLWDRENLYFLADMEDRDLLAKVTERDGQTWLDDVFELFFKPADEKGRIYGDQC